MTHVFTDTTMLQGFIADYSRDDNKCIDDDDCDYGDKCHPAADCTDLIGGYRWECPTTMTGDGYNKCGMLYTTSFSIIPISVS